LKPAECGLDLLGCSTLLVDSENALLEIDAGLDAAQNVIGRTKNAIEKAKFLSEQFEYPAVGFVSLVQKIYDDNVVLLTIPMAAPDTLFYALGIPGQIVVDY
jgi:hypothetical protein